MAYSKRYAGGFVDLPSTTTPVDSAFLNAVEATLLKLFDTDPTVDGQVPSWISASTKFGPALILNKNVDAAAAIAKSKLDFTGANGIVNADVAGAAAIARSKLDFGAGLVNADISAAAAIVYSKLNLAASLVAGDAAFAYAAYTPTWGSSGTQPAIGNGTVVGRKLVLGKFIQGSIVLTVGSTSTFGTGNYLLSLPAAPNGSTPVNFPLGEGIIVHSGSVYPVAPILSGSNIVLAIPAQPIVNFVGPTVPFTFASGDVIFVNFTYEAA